MSRKLYKNPFITKTARYNGISMSKSAALLLVLVFLTASCVSVAYTVFAVSEYSWVTKAPMHHARMRLGVAVVNGKICAIGGDDLSLMGNVLSPEMGYGSISSSNEEYDPVSDTWTFKAPMPTARTNFGIAVYKNKIYCIGGYVGNGSVTAVNEVYDPVTDTWETRAPMPTARSLPGANTVAGKIYLIGGRVGTYAYQSTLANEVYDPDADSWTTKTPSPIRITSLGSVVFYNQIYFIATKSTEKNPAQGGLILTYNPFADSWSFGKTSPTYGSACAIGVASGVKASKGVYFFDESATYMYDPLTESWINDTSMPTARGYAGVAVLSDDFYVIGGIFAPYEGYIVMTNSATTNEQYTPIGYGTVPPAVSVISPENKIYVVSNVSLAFTVNKPASWMGYSLDGQDNVTISGNTTLSGLSNGLHNVTVYAEDKFENMGASETVTFTISRETEAFSIRLAVAVAIVVAALVLMAAVGVGLSAYLKKRK